MLVQEETYVKAVQRIMDVKIKNKYRMSFPENASIAHTFTSSFKIPNRHSLTGLTP